MTRFQLLIQSFQKINWLANSRSKVSNLKYNYQMKIEVEMHCIKPPWIREFFFFYRIRLNTEQNFPAYFLNNFPVYHCIRTLWIHVPCIPFYSLDMNLQEYKYAFLGELAWANNFSCNISIGNLQIEGRKN